MKIGDYLRERRIPHGDFAASIGTSQAAVTRYANGTRIPRPAHMAAISKATGGLVTANDFQDAHEAGVEAVRAELERGAAA